MHNQVVVTAVCILTTFWMLKAIILSSSTQRAISWILSQVATAVAGFPKGMLRLRCRAHFSKATPGNPIAF